MNLLLKNIWMLVLTVSCLSACNKDKGNYEYVKIDPIGISDERVDKIIYVQQNGKLELKPELSFNGNTDELSYEWFVYLNSKGKSTRQDSTRIAVTKTLDYVVDPSVFTIGESYKLTYKVTNKATGVSYFHFYQLTVADKFTYGWMFLENIAGKADLSMILKDGTTFHHIYSERNPTVPLTNPNSFTISSTSIEDGVGQYVKRYYISSENDAVELDGMTMVKNADYKSLFFIAPTEVKPTYVGWAGSTTFGLILNKGLLHINYVGGFPGVKKFGSQMASPDFAYNYALAPQVITGSNWRDQYSALMYDKLNKRFYGASSTGLKRIDPNHIDNAILNMNNVGMDLIKLDSSYVATERSAVLKDGDKVYLFRFATRSVPEMPKITRSNTLINAPGIAHVSDLSCSTVTPHLYYESDGKLYKYEIASDTYTEEYTFGAGESATKVKFDRLGYGTNGARLVVCTWNGTEGKVYYFKVNANGSIGALDKTFTGFGKIIDLAYKY